MQHVQAVPGRLALRMLVEANTPGWPHTASCITGGCQNAPANVHHMYEAGVLDMMEGFQPHQRLVTRTHQSRAENGWQFRTGAHALPALGLAAGNMHLPLLDRQILRRANDTCARSQTGRHEEQPTRLTGVKGSCAFNKEQQAEFGLFGRAQPAQRRRCHPGAGMGKAVAT